MYCAMNKIHCPAPVQQQLNLVSLLYNYSLRFTYCGELKYSMSDLNYSVETQSDTF